MAAAVLQSTVRAADGLAGGGTVGAAAEGRNVMVRHGG